MTVLHHVSIALDDAPGWAVIADALVDGDIVVLLDRAARGMQEAQPANTGALVWSLPGQRRAVRWLLPTPERIESAALADGIEVADELQWLDLIATHSVLLEWG
jgi:hypothetical protein